MEIMYLGQHDSTHLPHFGDIHLEGSETLVMFQAPHMLVTPCNPAYSSNFALTDWKFNTCSIH